MAFAYFDHNATTPLHPAARAAMAPWLGERFGNPSSLHAAGRAARRAVEEARADVAALLGARPRDLIFTASGTEANNMVVAHAGRRAGFGGRVVLSAFEHPSVTGAADRLGAAGMEVVRVPPERDGRVDPGRFLAALTPDTRLACLMVANNELGTVQPVAEVAAGCRQRGVPVLADAAQAVGKLPVDVEELAVDYLVLGAHKFYGPLGAAALWVRDRAGLSRFLDGGGQEGHLRAGTENVVALVGMGAAARAAAAELGERKRRFRELRDRFEAGLGAIPDAVVHCASAPRLPQTSHVSFAGLEGEALSLRLDAAGFGVSTGSACSTGQPEPSRTLLAIGLSPEEALASIRVSFGVGNTVGEVDAFLAVLAREVAALRELRGTRERPRQQA